MTPAIDSERMVLCVEQGKGKERPLSVVHGREACRRELTHFSREIGRFGGLVSLGFAQPSLDGFL